MCNPVSLQLRGLVPLRSQPGQLTAHKIVFTNSKNGWADIVPLEDVATPLGGSHGVLHVMSEEDLAKLDRIEVGYKKVLVSVRCYDASIVQAWAYKFKEPESNEKFKPTQRYIDIIAFGCEYHGVDAAYVAFLRSVPSVPRPHPEEYKTIEIPSGCADRYFSQLEFEALNNAFALDHVVFQFQACLEDDDTGIVLFKSLGLMGIDATLRYTQLAYDPLFPVVSSYEEMTPQHRAYVVDLFLQTSTNSDKYEVVGRLL